LTIFKKFRSWRLFLNSNIIPTWHPLHLECSALRQNLQYPHQKESRQSVRVGKTKGARAGDIQMFIYKIQNDHKIFFCLQVFSSVEAMVVFYSKEPLKLYSSGLPSGSTVLNISPPPSRNWLLFQVKIFIIIFSIIWSHLKCIKTVLI
jgi:hypothetical protein